MSMSYIDQDRSRERALSGALSAIVVGTIGYALASGLAVKVWNALPPELPIHQYPAAPLPPPPPPHPVHKTTPHTEPQPQTITPPPTIPDTLPPLGPTTFHPDPGPTISLGPPTTIETPPPPPTRNLSSGVSPIGHPGDWATTDDYPAAALRSGDHGRTGFRLDIGTDGKPTACTVTASSGSDELDKATCRLLMRRARFHPAKGVDGTPVVASYSNGVTWAIPAD
jgi:periplasmic protein TonB